MDKYQLWDAVKAQLKLELHKGLYEIWVPPLLPVELDVARRELLLETPSAYARDFLEKRLSPQINQVASQVAGTALAVVFVARAKKVEAQAAQPIVFHDYNARGVPGDLAEVTPEELDWTREALRDKPTLQEYLSNPLEFLHSYLNLFLFGAQGTGKTHIAVCFAKCAIESEWRVVFVRPTKWLNRLRATFDAGRKGDRLAETEQDLLDELQETDLLVLDDLELRDCNEFGNSRLSEVIKARADHGERPTLVTTNYTPGELAAAGLSHSTLDRLMKGALYEFVGPSYREVQREQRVAALQARIELAREAAPRQ